MGTGSGALFSKSKKELLLHFSGKNEHIVTSIENGSPLELVPPEAPQVENPMTRRMTTVMNLSSWTCPAMS